MKIDITFRHLEQTDALKDRVHERLAKLERFIPRPLEAHVVLSTEKHRQRAEVTLSAPPAVLMADSETDDLYQAIDNVAHALERQVKKFRERLVDHHKDAREAAEVRSNTES